MNYRYKLFNGRNLLLGFFLLSLALGCKKIDQTYVHYENTNGTFDGNAYQYLRSQSPVYDSMLYAINRVPGLRDSIENGNITLFALPNACFNLALTNLNEARARAYRHPIYIKDFDVAELDTMLCRYILHGVYVSDSVAQFADGLTITDIHYDYPMQVQYTHESSSGYVEGGPELLKLSNRNRSIFERYWVTAQTNAIDIVTNNSVVHILSPGHDFGFGQVISRLDKKWQIIFHSHFDKEGDFDQDKWSFIARGNTEWNQYATDSSYVAYIDTALHLVAKVSDDPNDNATYQTGGITSKNTFNFLYGKVQLNAKIPLGEGTMPIVRLMPSEGIYGPWPRSGEMDILEHLNQDLQVTQKLYNEQYSTGITNSTSFRLGEYNTYGVEWTPDKITFLVDSVETFSYNRVPGAGSKLWPFDQKFYININMALGSSIINKDLPASLDIKWIKVYKHTP